MASVQIPIDDDKILDYIRENYGLVEGKSRVLAVEVEAQPRAANSSISHVVTVSIRYGLELGEIEKLAGL
ncbi:hypothetical protein [Microbacterium binotii]|uniref:hypothetical protein n=1 Tax=Microbacterium binotii TaxID=462710 RepID=UPI001F3F7067|nr:hypothetical protein [Microbacterium binotii]UIN31886.1 hypothetical protein LXM64_06785 [Microbacterium binotii]